MANWQKVEVAASRPYPVFLGVDLEDLGQYILNRQASGSHILVITQPSIAKYHSDRLTAGLKDFKVDVLYISEGEGEKSLDRLGALTSEAVRLGADRSTLVIALGGGVIGDLAGFFASVFMRGIRFVQVPTTLLAQVDSSIGGKVAVNHPAGKNLLGAFYPPLAVWTDFSVLTTLPWNEVQNGLAETVKHALIADIELFIFLEQHQEQIKDREPGIWREMVTRSVAVKVKIVSQDEREAGVRALLNMGHSFGHALETEAKYEGISHGQGVSLGIVAAAALARARGYISETEVERIVQLLESFELKTSISGKSTEKLLHLMEADKKNQAGRKVLILPKGIGQAVVVRDCRDEEILKAWEKIVK